jgi:hypothetical protein
MREGSQPLASIVGDDIIVISASAQTTSSSSPSSSSMESNNKREKNTHLQTFHFIQLHQILPTGGAQEIIVKIHLYIPEVQISDFAIEMPNEFHELYGDYTISFGNEDE